MTECAVCGKKLPFFYINRFGGVHYSCMEYYHDALEEIENSRTNKTLLLAQKNYRRSIARKQ